MPFLSVTMLHKSTIQSRSSDKTLKHAADNQTHSTIELKEDTVIVVLGASGDLAKKKTVCFTVGKVSVTLRRA